MIHRQDKYRLAVYAISFGFLIWGALFIYRSSFMTIAGIRYFSLFDDAMISMRYAWNLSHGYGLVWNPGIYVEGYTNLLMTLFMSVVTFLFDKRIAVLVVQISGVIFILVNAYVVMAIADQISPFQKDPFLNIYRLGSFILALGYYPLLYWSIMGMETGLVTLFLSLGGFIAFRGNPNQRLREIVILPVLMGLLYLVRPDTLVAAGPILAFYWYKISQGKSIKKKFNNSILISCVLLIFIIGMEVFRLGYYHQLWPNTYILKLTGVPLSVRIQNGIIFVKPFLISILPVLLVTIVGLLFHFKKEKLTLASIAAVLVAYQVYVGGDAWNYWRILAPFLPLILPVFLMELMDFAAKIGEVVYSRIARWKEADIVAGYLPASLLLTAIVFTGYLMNARFLPELLLIKKPYYAETHKVNVDTALLLNEITSDKAVVGVFWGGIIPYYTGKVAVDFLGKSDPYIANLPPDLSGAISYVGMTSRPGHNKFDLNYSIKELRPTYVQRFFWGSQDLTDWAKTEYVELEEQGIKLYLLKDSPDVYWDRVSQVEEVSK